MSIDCQNIAKLMGVVPPKNKDALMASIQGIWSRSQSKITDLQQELFHGKEQIQRAGEDLQVCRALHLPEEKKTTKNIISVKHTNTSNQLVLKSFILYKSSALV